jgi:hypothetical protein
LPPLAGTPKSASGRLAAGIAFTESLEKCYPEAPFQAHKPVKFCFRPVFLKTASKQKN